MNKAFGIQGRLQKFPVPDLKETIYKKDGIEIEISDREFLIGVDDEKEIEEAKEKARVLLASWNLKHNWNASLVFESRWAREVIGQKKSFKDLFGFSGLFGRRDMVVTRREQLISGTASIVTQEIIDTASFNNNDDIFQKALTNPALKTALLHFYEEVADSDRPLYGIYKAIEAITKYLGNDGRKQLGVLSGQDEIYVQDLMQTTQTVRHSPGHAPGNPTAKLDENECRRRAGIRGVFVIMAEYEH
jgi:hypothetical protein